MIFGINKMKTILMDIIKPFKYIIFGLLGLPIFLIFCIGMWFTTMFFTIFGVFKDIN